MPASQYSQYVFRCKVSNPCRIQYLLLQHRLWSLPMSCGKSSRYSSLYSYRTAMVFLLKILNITFNDDLCFQGFQTSMGLDSQIVCCKTVFCICFKDSTSEVVGPLLLSLTRPLHCLCIIYSSVNELFRVLFFSCSDHNLIDLQVISKKLLMITQILHLQRIGNAHIN